MAGFVADEDGGLVGVLGDTVEWFRDPAHWTGPQGVPQRLLEHVQISALALLLAVIPAVLIGLYIGHSRRFEFITVNIANLGRALPSFAILALVFPIQLQLGFGLSSVAIVVALILLAIPPILTNTYVGVKEVDRDTIEAAKGMGMKGGQILRTIELPLAAPLIVTGIRTAAVAVVATATLGAVVAGGGLGRFIVDGFAIASAGYSMVMAGALLVALLAVLTEFFFGWVERLVTPTRASRPRSGMSRASDLFVNRTANDSRVFEPPPPPTSLDGS